MPEMAFSLEMRNDFLPVMTEIPSAKNSVENAMSRAYRKSENAEALSTYWSQLKAAREEGEKNLTRMTLFVTRNADAIPVMATKCRQASPPRVTRRSKAMG